MADKKGLHGLPAREVVQDPNAQARQTPVEGKAPLPQIMAPRPFSIKGVEGTLARDFGKAAQAFESWITKKIPEWRLDGELQYAQGVAEQELQGNKWTKQGYMGMQVKTAADEWWQESLNDIESTSKQKDPAAYRQELSQTFKQMSDQFGKASPYVKGLLGSVASNMFTKLVSLQTKAHNQYNKEQTINSRINGLVSSATKFDPEDPDIANRELKEILSDPSGLSEEEERAVMVAAAKQSLELGKDNIAKMMGVHSDLFSIASTVGVSNAQLQATLIIESGARDYNADGSVVTSPKKARGRMQGVDKWMAKPGYGLPELPEGYTLDDLNYQAVRFLGRMNEEFGDPVLGSMAYNAGPTRFKAYINERWGGKTPVTDPNISMQEFIEAFPYEETRNYAKNIAAATAEYDPKTENAIRSHDLLSDGYTPAQVEELMDAQAKFQRTKSTEWERTRFTLEDQIISFASSTGLKQNAYDMIEAYAQTNGYDEQWALSMRNRVDSQVAANIKNKEKATRIEAYARENNIKALEKPDDIRKAFELKQAEINTHVNTLGLPEQEANDLRTAKYLDTMVKNDIIDPAFKSILNTELSKEIVDKDGNVSETAAAAYQQYRYLLEKGSLGLLDDLLDSETEDMVHLADVYMDNGGSADSALASGYAKIRLMHEGKAGSSNPVDTEELTRLSNSIVSNLSYKFWDNFRTDVIGGGINVLDTEVERAVLDSNGSFNRLLQQTAKAYYSTINHPDDKVRQQLAARKAVTSLMKRSTHIAGTMVASPKGEKRLLEYMPNASQYKHGANTAAVAYWANMGKHIYGDKYNDVNFLPTDPKATDPDYGWFRSFVHKGIESAKITARGPLSVTYLVSDNAQLYIAQKARGMPGMEVFDLGSGNLQFRPYMNTERTVTHPQAIVIPASTLDAFFDATRRGDDKALRELVRSERVRLGIIPADLNAQVLIRGN